MRRTSMTLLAAGLLAMSACGSPAEPAVGDGAATNTDVSIPVETAAAGADDTVAPADTAAPAEAAPESTVGEPTTEPSADATADAPVTTAAPSPAPTTTAPVAAPRPDDGCSADNSPTGTDVAEGPVPALEVLAESAANALPDLAVRRINCAGGWVNLKNEIPADKPLLIWFWAPH